MRIQLIFVFLFAVSIAVLSNVSGEPELLMVSVNPENVRMQCGEVDAIIEKDEDTGRYRVIKIVKDKYDSSGYTK